MPGGRFSILRFAFFVVLLSLLTFSAFAQEFSADFVNIGKDRSHSGPSKIFVGKDKMRIETDEGGEVGRGAAIMDFVNQKSITLMPQQKMYMESMPQMKMQEKNVLFRPDDPNNACPQYISLVKKHNPNENVTCRKVGEDTVNGRSTIKYVGTSNKGSGFVWIDPKLRFVVKWLNDKGDGTELRNIQEGSQDATLFQVPPDYHKFDMQQMMRQRQRPQ
ncbi:MAG TPA: hypothetical protein VJN48_01975 [Terriglobales bacterium]|nr:hypothetical protein [Terriglobales bacterium]